jgi:hypothetical protein
MAGASQLNLNPGAESSRSRSAFLTIAGRSSTKAGVRSKMLLLSFADGWRGTHECN